MSLDSHEKYKKKGIGLKEAFKGIGQVLLTERNFKIHLVVTLLVLILAFVTHFSRLEWIFLLLTIASVICLEIVNTCIEKILDYIHPQYDPMVGKIKDMAAGSVLIATIFAVIIGVILFLPKLIEL